MGVQFCIHALCLQVPHPSCVTWMPLHTVHLFAVPQVYCMVALDPQLR